ncbi:MAG: hypothetical protein R2749_30075 [Acidimicrobiales bacterium]
MLAALGAVVAVVARVARRALPLVHLLHLTLAFPTGHPTGSGSRYEPAWPTTCAGRCSAASRCPVQRPSRWPRLLALIGWLTIHDRRTRGHGDRVCAISTMLADELDLPKAGATSWPGRPCCTTWASWPCPPPSSTRPARSMPGSGPAWLHTVVGHQ